MSRGEESVPMTTTDAGVDDLERARRDEESVRTRFWPKLARVATKIPFAEDVLAGYYCAFDRATPTSVRMTLMAALAYFILPADAVPDFLPLIGFADDAGVLAAALGAVAASITDEHRTAARQALDKLGGTA
jgi:uncharacterized membrane protein YkvA (DUF1232 family)